MNLEQKIVGEKMGVVGRASNMLCIPIGEKAIMSKNGHYLTKYEIHCQCAWRFRDSEQKIITASSDIYLPPSNKKWSESFSWDVKGGNLFDERIEKFNSCYKDILVEAISISTCNDLKISFSNGIIFEAFRDTSAEENWRIIQRIPESIHLVSLGNSLKRE